MTKMGLSALRSGSAVAVMLTGLVAPAQLVVNATLTPAQLVEDVLLGGGVTVSNITFNGVPSPAGAQPGSASFTQDGDLGLDAGVLLSTGFPSSAIGPEGNFSSNDLENNGDDPDLEDIIGGNLTNYSILEFDFIPVGDSVKFRYVFASEEYPNFVCSFNDAFGFFLSGPGISGPYTDGAINIAVLPDGITPVTIANVNSGQGNNPNDPDCPAVNPEYYVNNTGGETVAFGGMTVPLTARAPVQCGQTYHIKIAIADAGGGSGGDFDTAYDSAVFLEGGSFTSSPFVPQLTPGPGIAGSTLFESCFPMNLAYIRLGDTAEADTFQVAYSGSFTNGEDIVPPLPAEVIFTAGQTAFPFTFNAPIDGDVSETLVITVSSFSDCVGDTINNVFSFTIDEAPVLSASGQSFTVDCGDAVDITPFVIGGYGAYTYDWGALGTTPVVSVAPLSDTSFPVTINDNCGLSVTTSVPVTVLPTPNPFSVQLEPAPTVSGNSVRESCFNVTLLFERTGGTAFADTAFITFGGQAQEGVDFTDLPDQVIFPQGETSVSITVTFPSDADDVETLLINLGDVSICNGGFSILPFTFIINPAPPLVSAGSNRSIPCQGSTTLTAAATGGYPPYGFEWDDGTVGATITVGPLTATQYTVEVTDSCGTTTEAIFNVDILPPPPLNMSIQGANSVTEACESTSINIIRPNGVQGDVVLDMSYTGSAGNGQDFDWPAQRTIPADLLNIIVPFQPLEDGTADPDENAVITASFTDACGRTVSASVTISIVDAEPIVLVTRNYLVDCGEGTIPISVVATGGYGALDLVWSTGDTGPETQAGIQVGASYEVTATDDCGRTASAAVEVIVDCDIEIPNVFTPNGDGVNDKFNIDGILSTRNTVKVFNRWGQLVFEAVNYGNNWGASGVPDGTYFYEVTVERDEKPYTGHLTILRN